MCRVHENDRQQYNARTTKPSTKPSTVQGLGPVTATRPRESTEIQSCHTHPLGLSNAMHVARNEERCSTDAARPPAREHPITLHAHEQVRGSTLHLLCKSKECRIYEKRGEYLKGLAKEARKVSSGSRKHEMVISSWHVNFA